MLFTKTGYALLFALAFSPLAGFAEETEREQRGFSLRLAETEAGLGFTEAVVPGKEEPIYLHPHNILTAKDVISVCFEPNPLRGISVNFQVNPAAGERMRKATRENMEKPLAIILEGKVLMAPIIRAEIADRFLMSGDISDEDLTRLFTALVLQGSVRKIP